MQIDQILSEIYTLTKARDLLATLGADGRSPKGKKMTTEGSNVQKRRLAHIRAVEAVKKALL